jgi:hypothetical protein
MRYKTDFQLGMDVVAIDKHIDERIAFEKHRGALNLGNLIAEKVGWKEIPADGKHLQLAVQCFSWEDWQILKSNIYALMPVQFVDDLARLFRESEGHILAESEYKTNQ